jgi:hypothetical protein
MIRIKEGVHFTILRSEMWHLFPIIEDAFARRGQQCWITCGTDAHGPDDPHFHGFALDFRTKHLDPTDKTNIATNLGRMLRDRYTVILEDENGPNEHLHIQVPKDHWRELV